MFKAMFALVWSSLGATGFTADLKDVSSLHEQAAVYWKQQDFVRAENLYRKALVIEEGLLGPSHPDVARSLTLVGEALYGQNRNEEALPLLSRALAIREKALGPEHPDVAYSLNNLAEAHRARGRFVAAEPLYRRALVILEKNFGANHTHLGTAYNNLATLYGDLGYYEKALPLYEHAKAIAERTAGPRSHPVAVALCNIAVVYTTLHKFRQGEAAVTQSLEIEESAEALTVFANILRSTRRKREAARIDVRITALRGKPDQKP
jgi:tetratricopeptide (TPR) repeat protein